jgi:Nucleotide modification associated domain 2
LGDIWHAVPDRKEFPTADVSEYYNTNNPMIYAYKMTDDNGGAPCVRDGFLTFAICKPEIRKIAKEDDVLIGIGGRNLISPSNV